MVSKAMCCNALQAGKLKSRPVKIGIFGLDNAGKTTTTRAIIGESLETVVPTVGYSSYKKRVGQHDITFYDLGGGKRVRDIWKHYLAEVYGLIYVVDSSEVDRLNECKEELQKLLSNKRVQGKPVLLLANKQDKNNALDDKEIVARINLEDLVTQNKCHCRLELCSAHVGIGNKVDPPIKAGLKWLLRIIDVLRETAGLEQRVQVDTEEAQRIEREQAKEKRLQVQKAREERLKAEKEVCDEAVDVEAPPSDPFKPIQLAVVEAAEKMQAEKANKAKNAPILPPLPLDSDTQSIPKEPAVGPNEYKLLNQIDLTAGNDNGSLSDNLDGGSNATDAAANRRRRRRPRPVNGTSTLDVESGNVVRAMSDLMEEATPRAPVNSNQSPLLSRRDKLDRTPRIPNTDMSAPIAGSLRLSGQSGIIEQQNGSSLSIALVRQGGPNVTSSDAFI